MSIDYPKILSGENTPRHKLVGDPFDTLLYGLNYAPAYEVGYYDILALSREVNIDPHYDLNFNTLDANYIFAVKDYTINYPQNSDFDKRLAGESANPNTFKVSTRPFELSFTMPIRLESWGYFDSVFSALYDYFLQGYKGSSTVYLGRVLSSNDTAIGSTSFFKIDNVADFLNLTPTFTAYIRSDDDSETSETVTVSSVSKSNRTLTFSSNTVNSHTPSKTYIWAKPTNPNTNREPTFSLFSAREGLLSGCIVDNISFSISPGEVLNATVNIKFTDIDRRYQKNMIDNFDTIISNINDRKPNYLINGTQCSVQSILSNGTFGLGGPSYSKLFYGYQEQFIRDFEINNITLKFENNLEAIYSLNAKSSITEKNFIKNLQPYGFFSKGRSITGTFEYSSPIKPYLFAEKIAGPGSINKNGLIFNLGSLKLSLPEVVWSPQSSESSVEKVHTKKVNFSLATKLLNFDPYFESTGIM